MRNTVILMVALAACFCAGCPKGGSPDGAGEGVSVADSTELVGQASPAIPDVPMPAGFHLLEDRSLDSAAPGVRMISYVFRGGSDKAAAARFFRKQMPSFGWQIRSDVGAQSVRTMDFTKESETCRIVIQDGGVFDKTEVRVQVFASARGDSYRKQ